MIRIDAGCNRRGESLVVAEHQAPLPGIEGGELAPREPGHHRGDVARVDQADLDGADRVDAGWRDEDA